MFKDIAVFQTAHAMAVHAGTRQSVVAENLAHADTPGYRARDLPSFAETLARDGTSPSHMRQTRVGHRMPSDHGVRASEIGAAPNTDPNGNTVSIEEEMFKAVEVKRQHDRAVSIYKSALGLLRNAIRTA